MTRQSHTAATRVSPRAVHASATASSNVPLTAQNLSSHTNYQNKNANINLDEDCSLLDDRVEALKATLMNLRTELPNSIVRKMARYYDGEMPMGRFLLDIEKFLSEDV